MATERAALFLPGPVTPKGGFLLAILTDGTKHECPGPKESSGLFSLQYCQLILQCSALTLAGQHWSDTSSSQTLIYKSSTGSSWDNVGDLVRDRVRVKEG